MASEFVITEAEKCLQNETFSEWHLLEHIFLFVMFYQFLVIIMLYVMQ